MALIGTLIDDFNGTSLDATKWTTYVGPGGTQTLSDSKLSLTINNTAGSYSQIYHAANETLTGSAFYAKVAPATAGGSRTILQISNTTTGFVVLQYIGSSNTMNARAYNAANVLLADLDLGAYDPTSWAYWRIRADSATNAFADRSADGTTWVQVASLGLLNFGSTVTVGINHQKDGTPAGSLTTIVDSVNLIADVTAPTIPGTPVISNGTPTSLTLTWTGSTDNVGVTAYRVYRDGVLYATTTLPHWTQQALTVSATWLGLAWGNSTFVAVAFNSSTAASSPDGITWTPQAMPVSAFWSAVTFGNGVFAALSQTTTIAASSTDGITWTQRTLPINAAYQSAAFGGGVFVAIADGVTTALSSANGTTWTQRAMPVAAAWQSVTYGNGVFVAVSYGATIAATSADGVTWTQRTLPVIANWKAVAYGNGVFVAVSTSASTVAATSPDGITWTQQAMPVAADWYNIAFGNGRFVAVAVGGTVSAFSTDGILWTQMSLPSARSWTKIAYGASRFVATAQNSAVAATTSPAPTTNVTGLDPGLSYSFTSTAVDAAGNESNPSAPVTYGDAAPVTRTALDTAGATDAVSLAWLRGMAVSDPAGATDGVSLSVIASSTVTRSDTAGATDALTSAWSRPLLLADRAGATDSVTTSAVGNVTLTFTDTAGGTDSVSAVSTAAVVATDTSGASDALTLSWARRLTVSDQAGASDAATVTGAGRYVFGDRAGAVDSVTLTAVTIRGFTEHAGATDAAQVSRLGALTLADTAGAADVLMMSIGQVVRALDPAGGADTVTLALVASRGYADRAGASDAVSLVVERGPRSFTDDAGASDAVLIDGRPPFPDSFDTWATADLGADTITIRNAPMVVTVPYGKHVRDWAAAVSTVVQRCSVQPYTDAEVMADREFVNTHLRLFAPSTVDLTAASRVVFDGVTFEVEGEPGAWRDLDGRPSHIEATLKRLTG